MASLNRFSGPTQTIGLVAFLMPLLTVYVPLAFAVILPVGAVLALISRATSSMPVFRFDRLSTILICGFLLFAGASALWSFAPDLAVDKITRTAAAVIAGLVFITAMKGLDAEAAKRVSSCFLAGMCLALVLIMIERISGGVLLRFNATDDLQNIFLNQFNRPLSVLSVLSVLIWPAVVILARRHWLLALAAVCAFAAGLPFFINTSAFASLFVGGFFFVVVYMLPKIGPMTVGLMMAAAVVLAPTIDHTLPPPKKLFETLNLPRSTYHRLVIWEFTTQRIAERPVLGWGFNTSRAMPGSQTNLDVSEKALPLHPHNAALQWRLELGILGALFGAAIVLVSTDMARRYAADRVARAGAVASIGATYVIAMISFGAWQTWWVSGMFLIAGTTVLVCRRRSPE